MSNQLASQLFTFEKSPVRTTEINNQIWFLANDICSILKYKNPRRAIELHCKEKGVTKRYTLTKGGEQEMTYINEPNLFRLIIKSKQEKAILFEEWVMEDLLPTIRKTGSYTITINPEQQQAIREAVKNRTQRTGEKYGAVYAKLGNKFKIAKYQQLPASQFDEAIEYLNNRHDQLTYLTNDELCILCWLCKASELMRRQLEQTAEGLFKLKSDYAAAFYTMSNEYMRIINEAKTMLEHKTRSIKPKREGFEVNSWENVLTFIRG